jgi:hypothetical protein
VKFSLVIFSFLLSSLLFAQSKEAVYFSYKPEQAEAQQALCELRLNDANTSLQKLSLSDPNNAAIAFLQLYTAYYRVLVQLNEKYLTEFNQRYVAFEKLHAKLPSASPYKLYTKGSATLMKAIIAGSFNKYIDAATGFRSAYLDLVLNQKKFPQFITNQKELGALEAMIGSLPSQYHWIISALGLDGTIQGGIKKLESYLSKCKLEPMIEQQQAAIYLALIEFNFGDKQKAWRFYKQYANKLETNLMQCYVLAYVGGKSGHNQEALQVLESRPNSAKYEQIAYLHFLKGEFMLHQLDFDAALSYKKYLISSETKGSEKDVYQRLSWIALLQNDKEKYLLYKHMAEKLQSKLGSEQKLLNQDLANQLLPNKELLKSRLWFDGGYYEQSLAILKQLSAQDLKSSYQKIEYQYRLGRVNHDMGNVGEAIKHYQECLNLGKGINTYFLPNAALQLGLIYKGLGYIDLAKKYLQQVSDYSGYDYEDSIRQKAKAGLSGIE